MCGIITILGGKTILVDCINGLKNLENRGYDSAGMDILKIHNLKLLNMLQLII